MKREEYYNSPEFLKQRLLGNVASEVHHKTQYLYDILNLVLADNPELMCFDKFNLVERQLRIVQLEASKLVSLCNDLTWKLRPKSFEDWDDYGPIPPGGRKNESGGLDNQQGQSSVEGGSPPPDNVGSTET